eukprot:gene25938-11614_t
MTIDDDCSCGANETRLNSDCSKGRGYKSNNAEGGGNKNRCKGEDTKPNSFRKPGARPDANSPQWKKIVLLADVGMALAPSARNAASSTIPCCTPDNATTNSGTSAGAGFGVGVGVATKRLWTWTGSDEYSPLNDRIDAPPLPLPAIQGSIVQGSSDLSVLTEKGLDQAAKTRDMFQPMRFDYVIFRPPAYNYSNGVNKEQVQEQYGAEYSKWYKSPATFELDGHAPVREMWYRGSLAWQEMLNIVESESINGSQGTEGSETKLLVVAHNNTNQSLLATALGLPCTYFRRWVQNNGAFSVLEITPSGDGSSPKVVLECLNQSPSSPFKDEKVTALKSPKTAARVASIVVPDSPDRSVDALLSMFQDDCTLSKPLKSQLALTGLGDGNDELVGLAWNRVRDVAASYADGSSVLVVTTGSSSATALLCKALDLDSTFLASLRMSPGSFSVLEFGGDPKSTAPAASPGLLGAAK